MRVVSLASVLLVACAGGTSNESTQVADTGYSRSCAVDDDCVPVYFGDSCSMCSSSNASIAKSSLSAYQGNSNTARNRCPASDTVGRCAFDDGITKCTANKCELIKCGGRPPAGPHACADGGT